MFGLSPFEAMLVGVIAIVLFGGNLPEVARKLGGSYRELRRSINDVQQQFREVERETNRAMSVSDSPQSSVADEEPAEPAAPKFTPPE